MRAKHSVQIISGALGFITTAYLAKFIKINIVIGSYATFFSINNAILPLSGAFLGLSGAGVVTLMKLLFSMMLSGGQLPLSHLAYYLPGFFAASYWASCSAMIRVVVPIGAMLLFIAHPVGAHAWVYAMYWWIPVVLYCSQRNNLFSTALGSTFIAHAVGSVIWLYTVPMTAPAWISLLPVVIIERLLFATGMVVVYKVLQLLLSIRTIPWIVRIGRWA